MKTYLQTIKYAQNFFLGISILIMLILPLIIVFKPELLSEKITLDLYNISHLTIFFVMIIRPLADIFIQTKIIRPLVILRKGVGVLSASIVVSFILAKIIIDPAGYFLDIFTLRYWSFENFALFAHLADISAILLIVTSNNFSKRILGTLWKKIQRLSYVYFYASSIYVLFVFDDYILLLAMFIVTLLTMIAYLKNQKRRSITPPIAPNPISNIPVANP
jgi:DMSO/TMAO reductase YedYZ heme-binding membrane subunit